MFGRTVESIDNGGRRCGTAGGSRGCLNISSLQKNTAHRAADISDDGGPIGCHWEIKPGGAGSSRKDSDSLGTVILFCAGRVASVTTGTAVSLSS
jgi:hypothetical protein